MEMIPNAIRFCCSFLHFSLYYYYFYIENNVMCRYGGGEKKV